MKKLILASASHARKELLKKLDIPFEVQRSVYNEIILRDIPPDELVKQLSLGKANNVANKNTDATVIGADLIIHFESKNLGKPATSEEAVEMLTKLSGKSHDVYTGYTVINKAEGKSATKAVKTTVYFKNLSEKEIEDYIEKGEFYNKAGSYSVHDTGANLIERIEGDFFNIMGLPLEDLSHTLNDFGFEINSQKFISGNMDLKEYKDHSFSENKISRNTYYSDLPRRNPLGHQLRNGESGNIKIKTGNPGTPDKNLNQRNKTEEVGNKKDYIKIPSHPAENRSDERNITPKVLKKDSGEIEKTDASKEKEEKKEEKTGIFRFLSTTDIVILFVITAIAGIVAFGIIFTQLGVISFLKNGR